MAQTVALSKHEALACVNTAVTCCEEVKAGPWRNAVCLIRNALNAHFVQDVQGRHAALFEGMDKLG